MELTNKTGAFEADPTPYQSDLRIDASADPDAGSNAPNGKPIWTADQAADNLARPGFSWEFNNYGELDDGVLTFGFWDLQSLVNSYYVNEDGTIAFNEAYYAQFAGGFAAFSAQQQAMAAANLQLWDDLITVTFQPASTVSEADITFGFTPMSPAAGAYAYYPAGDIDDQAYYDAYGFVESGRLSGDVWANIAYQSDFVNAGPGDYGWFAITHELGHALGLAHGGSYNASDDNDGDGKPDPITYNGDAYFFQDSQQYTIMSYFPGRATGAGWVDWDNLVYMMPSTPMVHDVLAVQNIYGADMTTRTGDTTYGFNSNAGNVVFDFTVNTDPVVTIWDAGGTDTLDFSGWSTGSIIDLNEGAFSSGGQGTTLAALQAKGFLGPNATQAQFAATMAAFNMGPQGQMTDNVAIAYGAKIENAVGGAGNDLIIGNGLNNLLKAGAGNDILVTGDGRDTLTGGTGNDIFVFTHKGVGDRVTDFETGKDKIDLSAFNGVDSSDVKISGNTLFVDTDSVKGYDLQIQVTSMAPSAGLFASKVITLADIIFGQANNAAATMNAFQASHFDFDGSGSADLLLV